MTLSFAAKARAEMSRERNKDEATVLANVARSTDNLLVIHNKQLASLLRQQKGFASKNLHHHYGQRFSLLCSARAKKPRFLNHRLSSARPSPIHATLACLGYTPRLAPLH
jgi:hypothetical protein